MVLSADGAKEAKLQQRTKNEYENEYEHIIFSYLLVRVTLEIIGPNRRIPDLRVRFWGDLDG